MNKTSKEYLDQMTDWEKSFYKTNNVKLYKYRSDIYRDLFTLQNRLIYVPSKEELNDPNESSLDLSSVYDSIRHYEDTNHPKDGISFEQEIKNLIEEIGIFSLCKSQREECLWSYYANGHKGFCVEYDAKILWKYFKHTKIANVLLEVEYSKNRTHASIENIRDYISQPIEFMRKTTASKSIKWSNEKEVRFVLNIKSKYVDIPLEAISAIYIGYKCSQSDIDLIKKSIRSLPNSNIKIFKMLFQKDSFNMSYEEIQND